MRLPDEVPVDSATADAVARRHGLGAVTVAPMESAGIINTVYRLGDKAVLRVPRRHPAHLEQLRRERAAIPAAVRAGVLTAGLVAFDDTEELLPVPYLIVEQLSGRDVEGEGIGAASAETWRLLGRDLALLHAQDHSDVGFPTGDNGDISEDPRQLVDQRVDDGWIAPIEGGWLLGWLERLAPLTGPSRAVLVHGDVQLSNVMIDASGRYTGIVDFGCSRVHDAAEDFVATPLRVVPAILDGYREVGPRDDTLEARILWRRLQVLLGILPRGNVPGCSWAEHPTSWLIDVIRFFADPPPSWAHLSPPPPR